MSELESRLSRRVNDRDLLASKNILRRGIYELERGSKTSCGASPA